MGTVEADLGEKVASLRRQAGLTQAALAEAVGVATETISRLERGAAMPSLARMEDVARVLGTGLDELFRFPARESARDRALERLLAVLRRRRADEIEMLTDVAKSLFSRRGSTRKK